MQIESLMTLMTKSLHDLPTCYTLLASTRHAAITTTTAQKNQLSIKKYKSSIFSKPRAKKQRMYLYLIRLHGK
jgi:hypothetical protein